MSNQITSKVRLQVLLDEDLASWYRALPVNSRQKHVNMAIRLGYQLTDTSKEQLISQLEEFRSRFDSQETDIHLLKKCVLNLQEQIEVLQKSSELEEDFID